jgi:hypothetical protein
MITYVFSALSADSYLIRPEQDTLQPCFHSLNQKWTSKENRDNKKINYKITAQYLGRRNIKEYRKRMN